MNFMHFLKFRHFSKIRYKNIILEKCREIYFEEKSSWLLPDPRGLIAMSKRA
jgi:hypothetical protein